MYALAGVNSFSTSLFFNFLAFRLRDSYGFGSLQTFAVGAGYGIVFAVSSWFGGRLGQRRGHYTALRWGFAGMASALALGVALPTWRGQLVTLALWTGAMCLTWANIEALVSRDESPRALPARLGIYNVVWAATAGAASPCGGWLTRHWGPTALFWAPAGIHVLQWLATWPLERWQAAVVAAPMPAVEPASTPLGPAYFRRIAWAANPFSFMAINALLVLSPGFTERFGWTTSGAAIWTSLWLPSSATGFFVLWLWPGWHYHFGLFAVSYAVLGLGFCAVAMTGSFAVFVGAQIAFGWAVALIYHSSLYYAMDGSDSHGEHGGIHEAMVGLGNFGGPALCAAGYAVSGHDGGSAWMMGGALALGAGVIAQLRARGIRTDASAPAETTISAGAPALDKAGSLPGKSGR